MPVKARNGVDCLAPMPDEAGYSVDTIHGDRPQLARLRARASALRTSEVQMLVATHVAPGGLDIDDRRLVINVDLAIVAQDYVHRLGAPVPRAPAAWRCPLCAPMEHRNRPRLKR